jgi:hypothetical protein
MSSHRLLAFLAIAFLLCAPSHAAKRAADGDYDRFGGWTKLQGKKTGFFHIEQIDGRFWFITPDGNAFFSKGVCSVNRDELEGKANATPADAKSGYTWSRSTAQRLRSWGVNTAGCWSIQAVGAQGIAWTPRPHLSNVHDQKLPDVFDPKWVTDVRQRAMKQCAPLKNDPWVLGYFTDNEIDWGKGNEKVARQYFRVMSEAIHAADPNHLILGCRFAGTPPMDVVRAMKGFADVISINNYSDKPPVDLLKKMHEASGLPVMVAEFSVKARDSGPLTSHGSGPVVATQQDRAQHFARYVETLAELNCCVGYHWFRYRDHPGNNQGLVKIKDEPWKTLADKFTELNPTLDRVHCR